jgi:WD40 repeat protein
VDLGVAYWRARFVLAARAIAARRDITLVHPPLTKSFICEAGPAASLVVLIVDEADAQRPIASADRDPNLPRLRVECARPGCCSARRGAASRALHVHRFSLNVKVVVKKGVASSTRTSSAPLGDERTKARARALTSAHRDGEPAAVPASHRRLSVRASSPVMPGRTLQGHRGPVQTLAVTPDGQRLLAGSRDALDLWDLESAQRLLTFERRGAEIRAMAISPDGRLALSGSADRCLTFWNIEQGRPLHSVTAHDDWVSSVAFSADGRLAASGSHDGSVKVWDVNACALRRAFDGHRDWILSVALSPDGRSVLYGSNDHMLTLRDVESGAVLLKFEAHRGAVLAVAFSSDGQYALSGSADHKLKLWDLSKGWLVRTFEGHGHWIRSVAVRGPFALSGSYDKTVKLWDLDTGTLVRTFGGPQDWVMCASFSIDGRLVIAGSLDGGIALWRATANSQGR